MCGSTVNPPGHHLDFKDLTSIREAYVCLPCEGLNFVDGEMRGRAKDINLMAMSLSAKKAEIALRLIHDIETNPGPDSCLGV